MKLVRMLLAHSKVAFRAPSSVRTVDWIGSGHIQPNAESYEAKHSNVTEMQLQSNMVPMSKMRARIIAAFNAALPVAQLGTLYGRAEQLDALSEAILDHGQHAVVYGERGSGKTSLVRVFGLQADKAGAIVIYQSCEKHETFADLIRPYLKEIPSAALPPGQFTRFREEIAALGDDFGPRDVVNFLDQISHTDILFVIDEFDRVTNASIQADIATFMKLLTDGLSPIRLLIVGIAQLVSELIEHHKSLRRHMVALPVGRISDTSGATLISEGARASGISFSAAAQKSIISLSCGSPYHIRLFCLHSALEAFRLGLETVDTRALNNGLRIAYERWKAFNPKDAGLFNQLTHLSDSKKIILWQVAETIARNDGLHFSEPQSTLKDIDVDMALSALGSAVTPRLATTKLIKFDDSLAPQFLLVAFSLNKQKKSHEDTTISNEECAA